MSIEKRLRINLYCHENLMRRHLEASHIILGNSIGIDGILRLRASVDCPRLAAGVKRRTWSAGRIPWGGWFRLAALVGLAGRENSSRWGKRKYHHQGKHRQEYPDS